MSGWGFDVSTSSTSYQQKKKFKKFIEVYDPQVDTMVWFEWNGWNRVHRWNPENERMWWMEWEFDPSYRKADEIPSVQFKNGSMSANMRRLPTK